MGQAYHFKMIVLSCLLICLQKDELNLDDETEFWKWYKQQTDFNFDEPAYLPRFVFGHYMKSYLSMLAKNIQIYQLIIIKFKRFIQILIWMKQINLLHMYYKFRTIMASVRLCIFNMWYICLP